MADCTLCCILSYYNNSPGFSFLGRGKHTRKNKSRRIIMINTIAKGVQILLDSLFDIIIIIQCCIFSKNDFFLLRTCCECCYTLIKSLKFCSFIESTFS